MRKALAILIAAVLCVACVAGCAQDKETASPSASSSATASKDDADEASASPSASAESSAEASAAESSDTVPIADGDGFDWFFTEWAKRMEQLDAADMTEQPEVSEGLSELVAQSRDWNSHQTGGTVKLELPTDSVVVTATGSETQLESASVQCTMELTSLEDGVTPSLFLFTLGAGALVEVLSGESEGGLNTVNESVAALLAGSAENGVITSEPVSFGNAQFVVSLDTQQRILSLAGTPAA